MRKIISLFISVVMVVVLLSSCTSKEIIEDEEVIEDKVLSYTSEYIPLTDIDFGINRDDLVASIESENHRTTKYSIDGEVLYNAVHRFLDGAEYGGSYEYCNVHITVKVCRELPISQWTYEKYPKNN